MILRQNYFVNKILLNQAKESIKPKEDDKPSRMNLVP